MRINLVTPFAEKDQVKALGARWDPTRKCWYIQDVKDLAPFARWVPQAGAAPAGSAAPAAATKTPRTGPAQVAPHCGCDVLPWEACVHTPRTA
jgi:hypothetical protein